MSQEDLAHLTYLVDLGLARILLQIDQLPDPLLPEDVVAAAYVLFETQPAEETAQVIEVDVRILLALQNAKVKFVILAHRS